ncbi:hypothetical protein CYLTODRAFT_441085 [Cylindrobasidium torrendii FP15055 ss-10]|uniref:Uncharacterized protein n=1 Tax=Cylindrobasidium torrendii FP15055 ss-10 TaxID=1314674 RepID=A0A0D7BNE8_9AGAR|nr:hypothetical protein CYLTODRAFT_441085 [Cylindrobasidium torrendii FP15055 ss-10]
MLAKGHTYTTTTEEQSVKAHLLPSSTSALPSFPTPQMQLYYPLILRGDKRSMPPSPPSSGNESTFNPNPCIIHPAPGVEARDFAYENHRFRSPETFDPFQALFELYRRLNQPTLTDFNPKRLHRLIENGYVPEDETLARLVDVDVRQYHAYRSTTHRTTESYIPLLPTGHERVKAWTKHERDEFFQDCAKLYILNPEASSGSGSPLSRCSRRRR